MRYSERCCLTRITEELLAVAGESNSQVGTGGMRSKILAADVALSLQVQVFIGKGSGEDKLVQIIKIMIKLTY